MANTYTLISSNVLSSAASSVTFSSIPSTYTDLVLRFSGRVDTVGPTDISFTINGTTTTYSSTTLSGSGSAASSNRQSISTAAYINNINDGTNYTASTFNSVEIYIPNYTVSASKPFGIDGTTENNATESFRVGQAALWRTNSTITSLGIAPYTSGNFVSGSSFYLYGIKNA